MYVGIRHNSNVNCYLTSAKMLGERKPVNYSYLKKKRLKITKKLQCRRQNIFWRKNPPVVLVTLQSNGEKLWKFTWNHTEMKIELDKNNMVTFSGFWHSIVFVYSILEFLTLLLVCCVMYPVQLWTCLSFPPHTYNILVNVIWSFRDWLPYENMNIRTKGFESEYLYMPLSSPGNREYGIVGGDINGLFGFFFVCNGLDMDIGHWPLDKKLNCSWVN